MSQYLEKLIQAVPGVVYQFRVGYDGRWSFPYLSEGVRELVECSPEEAYADPSVITNCILDEDRELVRRSVEQATEELIPWELEFRIRTHSGAIKWVRGQSQPERQDDGSVLRNGIFVDISKTKATETHLLRLQNIYAAVIVASRLISRTQNPDDLFSGICKIAVELGGMKMAWIGVPNLDTLQLNPVARLGEGVDILDEADFFARLDIADGRGQAATAFSENRTILNQDFLRNPNTKRWHDLGRNYGFGSSASFPIRENDQPIAVLTVYRADINGFEDESVALLERLSSDISHTVTALSGVAERKRLEEALRFRQFGLDQVDEGIFWIDKDARICEANGTACRMLGYTHSELLQLTVADIDPNITLENWPEHWQALRQNKILCFESCHKIRDGLIYPTEVVANYFEYQGVEYNCALVRNISERKEAEQALLQAKTDAEAANLAKTRFLAAASHDLRQPIQAINLFQDALRQTDLNAEQKTISDFLSKSVHSLSELLYSLLDVSKLDAGQVMPQFAKVKVEDLFKAVDAEFSSLAQQKGLRFKLSYPFKDVFLVTDPRLLMSVLRNLIDNSLKYTEKGGALVGFRKRGLNGILQVWDSGVGIESRYGEQVFEECFQVSNPARDRTKGLGLGLSIARRMARLLKGDVRYQSRLGRGTVFEIVLPLAELSEVTDEAGAMPKPESVSTLGVQDRLQFSGWRVVVIEDDPMVAKSIEFSLQTRGVRVTVFHSSELALASPDIMDADFYISDFSLPGLDGIRLLDSIQQRSAAPISAVLVTGESSHERMEMASSSHWKVLLKPVEPSALLAAMSEKKVYDNRNREPCFASQTNSVLVQVAQEC